jgi:hypothetical protein
MDANQREQQNAKIASEERLRFAKLMKEMLDGENARKMMKLAEAERRAEIEQVTGDID